MCRIGICSKFCGQNSRSHKTDTGHEHLSKEIKAHLCKNSYFFHCRPDMLFYNIRQINITVLFKDRYDTHETGNHCSYDRRNGSTLNSEGRKSQMAVNEQIIAKYIDNIRCHIRIHGNFRSSASLLRRINIQRYNIKHHTSHNNTEIGNSGSRCIAVASAKNNDIFRKHNT